MDDNKTNEQKAAAVPAGIKKAKERLKKDFPVVDNQYPEAIFELLILKKLENYMKDQEGFTIYDCNVALIELLNDRQKHGVFV